MSETKYNSPATDTSGLLGIVFIVLKLTGVINWSWWWVLAPFWIPISIIIILFMIVWLIEYFVQPRRRYGK